MSSRREFARTLLGGAAFLSGVRAARRPLDPLSPGIKISLQIPADFTADDLVFARQLGVEYVSIPTVGGRPRSFARLKQARRGRRS